MAERIEGLNLVLLGKIGAGKSASGNTILGREAFQSKKSPTSVTQVVTVESGTVGGRRVTVYDTPGLFNTKLKEEQIQQMINVNVLQRCESGLCVFLLVIKVDRFTGKERETVEKIEKLLGEERLKKTWILFTRGDQLEDENKSIDEFVNETEPLKRLVQKYDQRYHVFNNKPKGQVQELLTKIYSTYPDTKERGAKPKLTQVSSRDIFRRSTMWEHPMPVVSRARSPSQMTRIMEPKMLSCDEGSSGVPSTDRRIVLLGRSGVGKTAARNTILALSTCVSMSAKSVTCGYSISDGTVSGRSVTVVDTPGIFHTHMNPEELMTAIARSVYKARPGPHAFLIVLRVDDRFIEQEQQILQKINMLFGKEVLKYSIILFTHGDLIEEKSVEKLIERNSRLRDLVGQCGGRFHIFNNKDVNNRDQVNDLLQKIDTMIEENGGGHYSNQMYEDAQRFRREEEEKKHQEKKLRQEDTRIKYTEERIRAEFEGPPRFLQERLKAMRLREEERQQPEKFEREWGLHGEFSGDFDFDRYSRRGMVQKQEQRREEIERVIKDTERRIREEFEGPPRVLLERFKLMRLREEAEKTHREEIERVRKETEERVRAEFEGTQIFLLERLEAMTLSQEEEKTQREEKRRREEIERVRKETERRIRAEFEDSPMSLTYEFTLMRLRAEAEKTHREEIERVRKETEERVREEFEGPPMFILERLKLMRLREEAEKTHREEIERVRKETEERVRAEFEGPYGFVLQFFKAMTLSEEEEKTKQEEIERVKKETEEKIRAEFEGPPRFLQESLKSTTLSEEEKKTQKEEKQRREEIERVKKETEEKIRAEFEGPPRFLQERLKTLRLSMEDRIQKHLERQDRFERRMREMEKMREDIEEMSEEMEEMGPLWGHMMRRTEIRRMEKMRRMEEMRRMEKMRCIWGHKMRRTKMRRMEKMREEMEEMREEMEEMRCMEEMIEEMEEMREEMEEMREEMEEMRRMEEMMPMEIRHVQTRDVEMRRMIIRRMEMRRMEMQRELQEEIERVIKEMEENIRAEFKCPPR